MRHVELDAASADTRAAYFGRVMLKPLRHHDLNAVRGVSVPLSLLAAFGTDRQSRCTSIKYQLKSLYFLFAMLQPTPAAFLRDPVTVPRAERIEHYRAQADRYRQLAECDGPASLREGLVELARQCDAMAETLRQPAQRQ